MSFSQDLLDQARMLSTLDGSRPRQVNLRRAISAAYYSLFHLLLDDIEQQFAPGIRRSIEHGRIEAASHAILALYGYQQNQLQGKHSKEYKSPLPLRLVTVSQDLREVAWNFIDLKRHRHEADYNTRNSFTKNDTLALITSCGRAHEAWSTCRRTEGARAYLTTIVVDEKLKER